MNRGNRLDQFVQQKGTDLHDYIGGVHMYKLRENDKILRFSFQLLRCADILELILLPSGFAPVLINAVC